jgi:CheY-like chemotaxis protein
MPHVVIVEDDKMNARLFEVVLRRRGGFDVTVTEDIDELLRLARGRHVDLIVMDVSLANCSIDGQPVDGVDITRRIKEDPATSDIPVILTTAHAMRGDRERLLSLSGADHYLAKPILDQTELVERINSFLKKKEER